MKKIKAKDIKVGNYYKVFYLNKVRMVKVTHITGIFFKKYYCEFRLLYNHTVCLKRRDFIK